MDDGKQDVRRQYIFAAGISLILLISCFVYVWESYFIRETGRPFGGSDVNYYVEWTGEQARSMLNDPNHWNVLRLFGLYGFPFVIAFIFFFGVWLASFLYFKSYLNMERSVYGAFLALFATSYMAHAFYVCIWAQVLAFFWFMVMLTADRLKIRWLEYLALVCGCASHAVSSVIFLFYYLIDYEDKRKRRIAMVAFVFFALFMVGNLYNIRWSAYLNLDRFGSNDTIPPVWFIGFYMLNPFMLGTAWNSRNRLFLMFLFASLFAHNGRLTLFFIPFMVLEHVKRIEGRQGWFMSLIFNGLWAVMINLYFLRGVL